MSISLTKEPRGVVLVELAILLFFLILLFSGAYEFTQILRAKHLVEETSYEAVSYASRDKILLTAPNVADVQTEMESLAFIQSVEGLFAMLNDVGTPAFSLSIFDWSGTPWEAYVCRAANGTSTTKANCSASGFNRKLTLGNFPTSLRPAVKTRLIVVESQLPARTTSILRKLFRIDRHEIIIY